MRDHERDILDNVGRIIADPSRTNRRAFWEEMMKKHGTVRNKGRDGVSSHTIKMIEEVYRFWVLVQGWKVEALYPYNLAALRDLSKPGVVTQAELAGPRDWVDQHSEEEVRVVLERIPEYHHAWERHKVFKDAGLEPMRVKRLLVTQKFALYEDELDMLNGLLNLLPLTPNTKTKSPLRARGLRLLEALKLLSVMKTITPPLEIKED